MGAIGGVIGFGLTKAGCDVSAVARGATLAALREKGLRFTSGGPVESARLRVSDDPRSLGVQDLVVIAVKAPALAQAAASVTPLIGPNTIVLPAMNGVPWWFFQGFGGSLAGTALRSVDPSGTIASAIPAPNIIGCVVHLGASCPEPGFVKSLPLRTLIIGEPSGAMTERLASLGATPGEVGIRTPTQRLDPTRHLV